MFYMKSVIRMQKIESAFHNSIIAALTKLDIDNCIITRVAIAGDMRTAKIFYIVEHRCDNWEAVLGILDANKRSIVREIMKTFHGKSFPKITFLFDKGFHKADRINELLDNLPPPVEQDIGY